jgi:hypothetical protein
LGKKPPATASRTAATPTLKMVNSTTMVETGRTNSKDHEWNSANLDGTTTANLNLLNLRTTHDQIVILVP